MEEHCKPWISSTYPSTSLDSQALSSAASISTHPSRTQAESDILLVNIFPDSHCSACPDLHSILAESALLALVSMTDSILLPVASLDGRFLARSKANVFLYSTLSRPRPSLSEFFRVPGPSLHSCLKHRDSLFPLASFALDLCHGYLFVYAFLVQLNCPTAHSSVRNLCGYSVIPLYREGGLDAIDDLSVLAA